jgi:Predicted glycosyltransferase
MQIKELKIGTRLELRLLDNNGNKIGNTYISQMFESGDEKCIVVSSPIYESRLVFIPQKSKVLISFSTQKNEFMGFTATVNDRGHIGNISVLYLSMDTPIGKIQRRDYYRLDCNLDVGYRLHNPADGKDKGVMEDYRKALSKNISASGACIIVLEELPSNTILDIKINFIGACDIKAVCTVVRCIKMDMSKKSRYELGLRFIEISESDREYMVKYISEKQRLHLQKKSLNKSLGGI